MTNEQILEKAISLAIDGGWEDNMFEVMHYTHEHSKIATPEFLYQLIFNHQFAKALWGEKPPLQRRVYEKDYKGNRQLRLRGKRTGIAWQYHLQQMVIADDPIKYLGENI